MDEADFSFSTLTDNSERTKIGVIGSQDLKRTKIKEIKNFKKQFLTGGLRKFSSFSNRIASCEMKDVFVKKYERKRL